MTRAQIVQLKQSENRSALAALLDTPDGDRGDTYAADLDALTKRAADLEVEYRAAVASEASEESETETETRETPEDRELRELVQRADVGPIFDAALGGGAITGAEAELQAHFGLDGNQVPLALLQRRDDDQDLELRTTGVTPAPAAGSIGAQPRPIIPFVFPQGSLAYLGIPQPTVPVGEAVYTVLSTAATPGTPAKGADQAHSTAAFTAATLAPQRVQASLFYAREDAARLRGMGEALRQNLSDALADELDQFGLTGANGLLSGTNLANHDASGVTSFANYLSQFAWGRVDGRYATRVADLRILMGQATYAHAGTVYRTTNAAGELNAIEKLDEVTGGVRVSANMPAAVSNQQNALIRLGSLMDAVTPIWEGVTIIRDEVTQARAGEIVLTAVMLVAFQILRPSGFYKQETQHA